MLRSGRGVEGQRAQRAAGVERFRDLLCRAAEVTGEVGDGGVTAQTLGELVDSGADTQPKLFDTPRWMQRPLLVPEVPLDGPADGRHGERGEGAAHFGTETVDRLDQSERGDLADVLYIRPIPSIARGDAAGEIQVGLYEAVAQRRPGPWVGRGSQCLEPLPAVVVTAGAVGSALVRTAWTRLMTVELVLTVCLHLLNEARRHR